MFSSSRKSPFFQLLENQAEVVKEGAEALHQLVERFADAADLKRRAEHVRQVESKGDRIERQIIDELNRAFLTPIDREDIYAVATEMEFILDVIEGIADRMELYAVDKLTPEILTLAAGLVHETQALIQLVQGLPALNRSALHEAIHQLKETESEMDRYYREGVATLFTSDRLPPLEVLKLKEILESFEEASDHCEDVADLIERIVIKHA